VFAKAVVPDPGDGTDAAALLCIDGGLGAGPTPSVAAGLGAAAPDLGTELGVPAALDVGVEPGVAVATSGAAGGIGALATLGVAGGWKIALELGAINEPTATALLNAAPAHVASSAADASTCNCGRTELVAPGSVFGSDAAEAGALALRTADGPATGAEDARGADAGGSAVAGAVTELGNVSKAFTKSAMSSAKSNGLADAVAGAGAATGILPLSAVKTSVAPAGDDPATPVADDAPAGLAAPAVPGEPAAADTPDPPAVPGEPAAADTPDPPAAPGEPAVGDTPDPPATLDEPATADVPDPPAARSEPATPCAPVTPAAPAGSAPAGPAPTPPIPANTLAVTGLRNPASNTTRNGCFPLNPAARTFNCGSSAITVPTPVITAEHRARQRCTSNRAASPVIHWLAPLAKAVRPSKLIASLTRTQGKPCFIRFMKPMLSSVASASMRPASTRIPARNSASAPCPLTCGLGS
jgi:hypothetical protein